MIPKRLLPLSVIHKRNTSTLFSGITLPSTQSPAWVSGQEGFALLSASGLPGAVTASITGVSSGITVSEIISLSSSITQARSANKYTSVIQVSSLAGSGLLTGKMVYGTGQPVNNLTTISTTMKGRIRASRLPNTIESGTSQQLLERWYFYTNDFSGILPSDILVIDYVNYEVESIEKVYPGTNIVHHGRAFLKRFN